MLIALTGGIGSGKSTVAAMLQARGAAILDADLFAREVLAPDSPGLQQVRKQFGPTVFNSDGTLSRKTLAQRIFSDPRERQRLEAIVHPRVRERFQEELRRIRSGTNVPPAIVYVVPLFFEAGLPRHEFDHVLCVLAPRDLTIRRIMARDGCSQGDAEQRLSAQLPPEEKASLADSVIQNDGDLEGLGERVTAWIGRYLPSLSGTAAP